MSAGGFEMEPKVAKDWLIVVAITSAAIFGILCLSNIGEISELLNQWPQPQHSETPVARNHGGTPDYNPPYLKLNRFTENYETAKTKAVVYGVLALGVPLGIFITWRYGLMFLLSLRKGHLKLISVIPGVILGLFAAVHIFRLAVLVNKDPFGYRHPAEFREAIIYAVLYVTLALAVPLAIHIVLTRLSSYGRDRESTEAKDPGTAKPDSPVKLQSPNESPHSTNEKEAIAPVRPARIGEKCPHCSATITTASRWCGACGRFMDDSAKGVVVVQQTEESTRPLEQNRIGIGGAVCILVLLLVILIAVAFPPAPKNSQQQAALPPAISPEIAFRDTVDGRMWYVNDGNKNDALVRAAAQGYHDAVERMLKWNPNVNHRDSENATPLILASWSGHATIVNLLLTRKPDVNAKTTSGHTALMRVCMNGHEVIVRMLLDNGADCNVKTNHGGTALLFAKDKPRIAEMLKARGATE